MTGVTRSRHSDPMVLIADPLPHDATARRPRWAELPAEVRAAVEERLGAPVVASASQDAGFTDGFASRLELADGSRAFVKAIDEARNPLVHASYRRELQVVRALPPGVPATRLRWHAELPGGWLVLAFEDVAGRPPQRPWRPGELRAVLDVLPTLAAELTPPPAGLELPALGLEDPDRAFWRALDGAAPGAPPADRLRDLAALEDGWIERVAGDTAVHFDLRDDNLLLADDGRVLVCDWNWLTVGAPWLDLAGLLISVHGDGLDADAVLASSPLTRGVPAIAVDSYLAALAGFFTESAARDRLPSSPWLRVHQAWWRDATLSWLGRRRGW
jgi:hypothetical protein